MSLSAIETSLEQQSSINPKLILFWLFVIAGLLVGFLNPWSPALNPLGHKVLMGMIIAVGLWVFKPWDIPFSVTGCLFNWNELVW